MDNLYIVKDRLNEALNLRGMTAADLAKKSGLNKSSISRYLTGENIPRSIAIGKMSKALGVNPAWVLGYDVPIEAADPGSVKEGSLIADEKRIDFEQLNDLNKERLIAYYEALRDSQNEQS